MPQNDIDKILEELKARRQRSKPVQSNVPQTEPETEKSAEEAVKDGEGWLSLEDLKVAMEG